MNPLRVAAVFRRIVAQFRRDPRSLALLFVAPLAIIALLGWVLGSQSAASARIAVVNESANAGAGTVVTRLQSALEGQPGITMVRSVADDSTARQMLKDKQLDLVVVLPADFSLQSRKIDVLTLGITQPESTALCRPSRRP